MSTSEVSLQLSCDNAAAELLVVNGEFKLVAKGSTPLNTKVEPGIYALKAKIGAQVHEQLQVIDGSQQSYAFYLKAPEFESAMPLTHTKTSREYHQYSLDRFTQPGEPFIALGEGSVIVLYVRDTSRRNFEHKREQEVEYSSNFDGFRLMDAAGAELVNFDEKATRSIDQGYIGAQVRVSPGHYVLAWERGDQETRLALNTAPGWVLQVFIRLQPVAANSVAMHPDFSEAAFAYDRIGMKYLADRDDFRMLEAARLALLDRRNIVTGEMMRNILTGKYDNPMLGVYGAYLLVGAPEIDLDLLGRVITNTATLLAGGDNPDIVALAWIYASKTKARPIGFDTRPWAEILASLKGPPLLVQSWDALVACAQGAQLDISTLPAFRVAGDLAVSGIVLTWEHRKQKSAAVDELGDEASSMFTRLGKAVWNTVAPRLLGRKADGTQAPLPALEVKVADITTPEAAADALRLLAKKAKWDNWLKLVYKDRQKADSVATFSPLQRDLISTLARATLEPETAEGINERYINSVMQAHRVPLSTVAAALRALDVVAVSVEVFKRLKAALSSLPSQKAATSE
jgi:hypothetical protein